MRIKKGAVVVLATVLVVLITSAVLIYMNFIKKQSVSVNAAVKDVKVEGSFNDTEKDKETIKTKKKGMNGNEFFMEIPDGKRVAFLTFDDGPTPKVTPKVLDALEKSSVKATFFVIGKNAEQNKDLIKQEKDKGHIIGNHTYSHDMAKIYAKPEAFFEDLRKGENVIKDILGEKYETKLIRFPGGSSEGKNGKYEPIKGLCIPKSIEEGYTYVDWNSECGDAEGKRNKTPAEMVQEVKKTVTGKRHVVLLMHDASDKQATAEALPQIIDYLKSQGFEFKTLDNQ